MSTYGLSTDTAYAAAQHKAPRRLYPGDPIPEQPHIDDDWFRFYGPKPGTEDGTDAFEVHELCAGPRCDYRPDEPCPWHKPGCDCSEGECQR